MDKKLIIAALSAAVLLTACGKASDKDQGASAPKKDSSTAVTAAEESSIAEESGETEESSEADESSEAETEAPAESAPEVSSAADSSEAETPAEPEIVHVSGTGYGYDVDFSKWVDASELATINAESSTESIECILGWLGDNSSTVLFSSNQTVNDLSQYDINEIAQQYFEKDNPPEGQMLIDWSTLEINGRPWMRREYTLDASISGVESRLLQYTAFNGYTELNVCFTIAEKSVSAIDDDLRDLMWSVQFE
jgi:hypothetical protein